MRNAPAGTSLLQSHAEQDHRDRIVQNNKNNHIPHNHHNHNHNHLHQRQIDVTVAAVTSTISVIQEVDIDQNGATVEIKTWLAASTTVQAPTDPTVAPLTNIEAVPLTAAPAAIVSSTSMGAGQWSSAQTSPSLSSSQVLSVTSTPYLGSNSSSSSRTAFRSFSTNLFNHTTSSSSSHSRTSTPSSSSSNSLLTSSPLISSSIASYYSSNSPNPTIAGGAGPGSGSGATASSSATSTAVAGGTGGSSDAGSSPSTPAVVGGVVGGIAGIVFIVALLMVLVRWRKRKQSILRLGDGPSDTRAISAGDPNNNGGNPPSGAGTGPVTQMTDRSLPFTIPAALANLTGYNKRTSNQPSLGHSSTAGSEKGFYRVSGRKLPSVFTHGGDGYGDSPPQPSSARAPHDSLASSSFYRDSQGFYGGAGSPTSPSPYGPPTIPIAGSIIASPTISPWAAGRDSAVPITRPSPARTPVISEGAWGPPSPVLTGVGDEPLPPRRPDGLGRSHASRDGSRGSRFTEEV